MAGFNLDMSAALEIERKLMSPSIHKCPKLYMHLSVWGQEPEQV